MLLKPGCESSLLLHPPTQAQAEARNSERNCTLGNERERSDKASETIARDGAPALVEVSRGVNSSSSGEMPKRKANWWPPSILSDPDVLSVDDEGRFVLCKICHVHYAVHGGKRPKPVIMNSNFRTRAWEVHKERTNSHRLQKQQERLQQANNNSERVAKKLQSLNAEYQASTMRHGDAYNMRHTNVFDQRSAGYKEYWGTLRDVYTSSGAASGGAAIVASYRKPHHRNSALVKPARKESKETEADSTTPGDSGSSEEAFKPAVVVHDASLINAIERLTDATSEQIANLYHRQSLDTREALAGLTSVMTDLRVQHGDAFDRIIELQEKHLKVMEDILEVKLRKEAARNARSCSSNESSSEGSSGSSPGSSTNEADSTTN
ncbi:hypothetical protein PF004_g18172 [Phytophthora fragariae]|uniref:Uncharacterized protein n=1 Tax=Phytophthora fragariae TaxID=53985 RepID=A0A6G0NDA5_9STRA|nr:hypothetical protein PF004_g18172 [Phytophthora fragariae]